MTGFSKEEIAGKHITQLGTLRTRDIPKYVKVFSDIVRGKIAEPIEFSFLRKDGALRRGESRVGLIKRDGKTIGVQVILRDVTERKKSREKLLASEKKYRTIIEMAPEGIVTINMNGVIVSSNPAAERISGYPKSELIGKHFSSLESLAAEDKLRFQMLFNSILTGKEVNPFEVTLTHKDGIPYHVEVNVGVLKEREKTIGLQVIFRDVTERKRVQEELNKLAKFPSENPNPVLRIRKDGVILYANAASESWLNKWKSGVGKSVPKQWTEHIMDVLSLGKRKEVEFKHENRICTFIFTPITKANYVNIYGIDISERKQMEETLRESEYKFRILFEQAAGPIVLVDLETQGIVDFNDKAHVTLGYTREEFQKLKIFDLEMRESLDDTRAHTNYIKKEGEDIFETRLRTKNGELRDFQIKVRKVSFAGRDYLIGIWNDITDLKWMEGELRNHTRHLEELVEEKTADLRESEELYRSLVETSPEAIMLSTIEGKIVNINTQGAKLFGFESKEKMLATEKTIFDYIISEDQQRALENAKKILEDGRIRHIEFTMLKKDGSSFPGKVSLSLNKDSEGTPKSIIGVLRDLTERKRMENQLLETKRMATIGETAGMVGHDLRNPLQAIVNTVYLANLKLDALPGEATEKGELKAYLGTVERQVGYMNKIVSDLLDFARPIHPKFTETSINQLIQSTLLSIEVPETVKVSVAIPKKMKLKIDAPLIRRVFINLITNAIQAMPDGGTLTIKTSKKEGEVIIDVEDTGVGIREEDLPKLFQPLFTTKSKGQGFGLPVCKRIVDAHGGEITVKSKKGKGSTFTVKLPIKD